jgi:tetratricopeptide (TPR) repeat protein
MNPSVIPLALCMAAWQANAAFGQESVPSLPVAYETLPFEKDAVVAGVPGQALLENFITHEQPAAVIPALLHFINRFPQDPYTPRLTFAAGEILLQAAKYAEALEMFERLDAKEKSDPFVWLAAFRTGECLVALGRLQEAHAVWRGLMVTEANGYRPALAGSLAWLEMRLGFYAQARERLQAVLSEYPELEQEVSFREALGTACFMQEDWATALSWLDGLADPQARALRGLAAKALDRGEEAEQDVRAALGSGTAGPMMLQIGLAKLAEWNIGKNAFAAAEYLLTVLTASFPGTWCAAWGNLHLAALALEQGNPMHAQNSLSAASFWPEDSHLRGLAGILEAQIAMRRQDFQAALKIWNQLGSILLLREEHAYARLGSLISELSLRRFAAADTHVKLFLKQFPQSESRALVEYLQAWMYAQAGKTMAATEIFQNIVLNDPYSSVIESALMQMAELGYRNRNWNGLIAKTAKLFETLQMNFISAHPEFRAWTAFFFAED